MKLVGVILAALLLGGVPLHAVPSLQTEISALTMRGAGVQYAGKPATIKPVTALGEKIELNGLRYFHALMVEGLCAEDPATGAITCFPVGQLSIAAGWYAPKEGERLSDAIRGLYRQGDTLWVGSNGVGILAYNTKERTWTRYDTGDTPVIGNHIDVLHADDQYIFASLGYHRERPDQEPSLHVFSVAKGCWRRLSAISSRDALVLGSSEDLIVQMGFDYRIYAHQAHVPIGGKATPGLSHPRITPYPNGEFLLVYDHGKAQTLERLPNGQIILGRMIQTILLMRRKDLDAAFTPDHQ